MADEFTGDLREQVVVEAWSGDTDLAGDTSGGWVAQGTAWAMLVPHERVYLNDLAGEGRVSRPRFHLTLRRRAGIGLATRFLWRGHTLVVLRIEPDPRRRDRMTLLVEQRA